METIRLSGNEYDRIAKLGESTGFRIYFPIFTGEGNTAISLIRRAQDVMPKAYSPYSQHPVGAALKCDRSGHIFTGCNVENCIYLATHAEQSAIAEMIKICGPEPKPLIETIAVVLIVEKEEDYAVPCGLCLQFIREFGMPNQTRILGAKMNKKGEIWAVEIALLNELLPHSFGPQNLEHLKA